MLIEKNFINKLKRFGINTYEAKIWTALLSRGISTAGELSDISNVPRSRAYDVLESLEKKGFIITKIGRPIKYIAVDPKEVLERVKKRTKDDLGQQLDEIDKLKASPVVKDLQLLHEQSINKFDPYELSASLTGRNKIYNHINSLIKNAGKSVIISGTSADIFSAQNVISKKKDMVKKLDGNARFCVVDESEIVFFLTDETVSADFETAIHVKSELFAKALSKMAKNL